MHVEEGRVSESEGAMYERSFPDASGSLRSVERTSGVWGYGLQLLSFIVVALLAGCGGQPVTVHLSALTAGTGTFQSGMPATLILPGGFSGTPVASQTTVVMAPQSGTDTTRTLTVTNVAGGPGGTYVLTVTLPTLTITAPATYLFTARGSTTTTSFDTNPGTAIVVQPGAQLLSVTPASGRAAQTLDVTINAISTTFANGTTQASFGAGISVNGAAAGTAGTVSVTNATTAVAHLVIDPTAATGARTVTVTTGPQTLTLASAFTVTPLPTPPVASAGGPYTGTTGTAISFTAAGSSDPAGLSLTYAWTFGDGGTGTGVAPTHTYATAGHYTATVVVTNSQGASSSATAAVTVSDPPKPPVASAGGPYTGTTGTAITFSAGGSTDPGGLSLTYAWTFGDGATGTGVAPTHTYATAGTYAVTVTATNSASLTNAATTTSTVTDAAQPPVANAGGPYTGTAGIAVTFSGVGSTDPKGKALTYAWNFGDGGTGTGVSATHTYASAGTFTVSLTVTNTDNLSSTKTTTATIVAAPQPPVADAGGPYTGTAGTAVTFSGAGSSDPKAEALTYAWSFGDGGTASGATPTHTYAAAGTYTVSLTVTNTDGLTSSKSTTAVVSAAPQAPVSNVGGPYAGLAGSAVTFNGAGSSDPKGETLTYSWTFGDGGTASVPSPTHTYAAAGTYTVSLKVTNTDSLSSTSSTTAVIAAAPQPPVANAGGPYTGTAGTAVTFNGTGSSDPKGETLTYAWTFGDGGTAAVASPTHTYSTPGTYTVTLSVTNTDSLTSSSSTTAVIAAAPQPPVAKVGGPYTGTAGVAVTFSGAGSSDPTSETLTYAWSFGDGGTANTASPTHTYSTAGSYTVSLTVTNTDHLTSTASTTAVIAAAPQAPVANVGGPYTGTAGVTVSFNGAASSDPKGETLTYAWTFGDGGTATGVAPTHTYASAGTFTVTLTVTNTDTLSASSTTTAVIAAAAQPPVANAGGPYTGTAGVAVTFSGAGSSDPKSEALTYAWTFGDGSTGTGVAPTHTYATAGTFNVILVVTNTDTLSSTPSTTTATIAAAPQAPVANAGGPYTGTTGTAVTFSGAASSDPKSEALTYAWMFGDGETGTGVAPTHTYTTAGTYNVSLVVTNTDNLHSTASTTTAVITAPAGQPPVAVAGGPYTGVAGTAISFSGSGSSDPKSEALTYAWMFGDGETGTGVSPTHTYAAAGTFTVSLTVTNTDNLSSTATTTATVTASPQPPVARPGGPYTGTMGVAVSFSGAASTDPTSETLTYAWNFGDGGTAAGATPTHTYAAAGTYTVSLTVTNTDNLTSTATTTATIATPAAQAPVANAGGPYTGVANTAVNFSGAASTDPKGEALTYAWSYGDGGTGSGATSSHIYATAGTYTVSLTVTNTDSASASATTTATIVAAPAVAPIISTGGPYSGTAGQAITFNGAKSTDPASPSGNAFALTYAWNFGDGSNGAGPSPVHTYAAAGTYAVTLTVTTPTGGTASSSTSATIAAADSTSGTAPNVTVNGPYTGTEGNAVSFSSAGTSDPNNAALTYVWAFGDGGTGTGPSPTHTYADAGTFSVVLTVNNGTNTVSASTTATITGGTPTPNLTANAGGPYSGNVNSPVQFDGTDTTDPSGRQLTYLWDFGDGSTGGSSQPSHTYTASGTYTVSLNVTDGATGNGNATTQVTVGGPAPESITANAGGPYTDVTGHSVTFDASKSTDSLDNPLTYSWSFGDGTTGTGATPGHSYATAGTYTATVTVTSGTVSSTAMATANIASALTVMVTTPTANALFGANTITVSGTVSAPGLSVNVNGVPAIVSGTSFTANGVSLREGVNLITATATDNNGGIGSGSVSVILDATAPTISITSPANGTTVSSPSITVAGLVNDIVTGTIGSNDVSVSVNGVAAKVANRSYSLGELLLVPGSNTITVTATDNVGHIATATSTVQYAPPTSQLSLVMLSGNGQVAAVHSMLPQPLVVQLRASDGTPVAGRPVTFTVTRSDGQVEVMPTIAQSLYVTTDSTGKASVLFQLGSRTGLGVNQVTASTPGASGTVLFAADSTSTVPTQIHAVRGENQRGLLGEPLSESLQVIVTDDFANPIPGITVNYAVVSGDGTLDHTSAVTDSNGKAAASLTLGQQEGLGNYSVSANFTGSAQPPIVFVSSGFAAGPVANTSVSGVVLDNSNTPITNATVRLLGTMLSTVSDTSGRFTINGAPVGTVTLSVDGSTSTSTHTFPFLSFVLQDLPGQNNTINKPIYLPFIDVDDAQTVGGDDPVTLTMRGVPGLAFTIAPHSVTFPDGSTVGKMSISQVKADMVPMPPSNGTAPDLIWTLQPAGARFSVPVQVTLPNTQSLPPGTVSEMYQYDHDLEQFVSAGTAHVSADGSVIVSDPGFGITKAGWGHGPNTPAPPNCTQSCKPNNNCAKWTQTANCQCIKTPINNGAACGSAAVTSCINPGKCVNGNCNSGPKPDGTTCDDNRFCTEPDKCSAGLCKGTPIPDKPDPDNIPAVDQISIQQNFSLITGSVATFLDNLHIPAQLQPTFQLNYNKGTLTCCQALQQKNVKIHENSFQAGLQVVAGPYPIIIGTVPLGVYVPGLGTQGVFGQAQVAFLGVYAHRVDSCKMSDCYLSGPQGSIQLSGGLGVNLGKWANANVSLTGGLAADLTFGCGQATFKFYTLPIQVQGQVTLLTGTSVPVVNKILVNSYVIYQKTVPF